MSSSFQISWKSHFQKSNWLKVWLLWRCKQLKHYKFSRSGRLVCCLSKIMFMGKLCLGKWKTNGQTGINYQLTVLATGDIFVDNLLMVSRIFISVLPSLFCLFDYCMYANDVLLCICMQIMYNNSLHLMHLGCRSGTQKIHPGFGKCV